MNQEASSQAPTRHTVLVALSIISLIIVALALVAAALLITKAPSLLNERGLRSSFHSRDYADKPRSDPTGKDLQSTRNFNANARVSGYNLELKVLASARSLSVSALTMVPGAENRMSDGSMIKRIVGDPTFLAESSEGTWTGPVRLSVFVDTAGEESHITIPAIISVSVNKDNSAGQAVIEIINDPANDTAHELSTQRSQAATHLRNVTLSNIPLF